MQQYRLYYFDKNDHIIMAQDFAARDDDDALCHAVPLTKTHAIEVWQLNRMIGRLSKGSHTQLAA
jgi:hypothetical protein